MNMKRHLYLSKRRSFYFKILYFIQITQKPLSSGCTVLWKYIFIQQRFHFISKEKRSNKTHITSPVLYKKIWRERLSKDTNGITIVALCLRWRLRFNVYMTKETYKIYFFHLKHHDDFVLVFHLILLYCR